jgi:hypothetical protein
MSVKKIFLPLIGSCGIARGDEGGLSKRLRVQTVMREKGYAAVRGWVRTHDAMMHWVVIHMG